MIQVVVEVEHVKEKGKRRVEGAQYEFKVEILLVEGESSCKHEKLIGGLIADSIKEAQEAVMLKAVEVFEDKPVDYRGNGRGRGGETLH